MARGRKKAKTGRDPNYPVDLPGDIARGMEQFTGVAVQPGWTTHTATDAGFDPMEVPEPEPEAEETDWLDQLGAGLMNNGTATGIYNLLHYNQFDDERPEVFNPLDHLTDEEVSSSAGAVLVEAESDKDLQKKREQLARGRRLEDIIDKGPMYSIIPHVFGAVLDVPNLLTMALPVAATGGIATRVLTGAVLGATAGAAEEGVLQATHPERTLADGLASVAFSGVAGAVIGGAFGRSMSAATRDAGAMMKFAHDSVVPPKPVMGEVPHGAVGAAIPVSTRPADADRLVFEPLIKGYQKLMSKVGFGAFSLSPVNLDLAVSPSNVVRGFARDLVDVGVLNRGEKMYGLSSGSAPVAAMTEETNAILFSLGKGLNHAWNGYKKAGGKLSEGDFFREVGEAGVTGRATNPFAQAVVDEIKKSIYVPLRDRLREIPQFKDIPDDYWTHSWTTRKIIAGARDGEGQTFRQALERHFIMKGEAKLKTAKGEAEKAAIREDMDYARITAQDVEDQIRSTPVGRHGHVMIKERGSLKERTLDIPPAKFHTWMEKDVRLLLPRYVKSVLSDYKTFQKFGHLDFERVKAEVIEDYRVMADDLHRAAKDPKKIERKLLSLDDHMQQDIRKLEQVWNGVRGVNDLPADPTLQLAKEGSRIFRSWTYLRTLGSVALAQLSDPFQLTAREGFTRTFGGLLKDAIHGFSGWKGTRIEGQQAGTITRMFSDGARIRNLMDVEEPYAIGSKTGRAVTTVTDAFSKYTLLNAINHIWRTWAGASAMTRILDTADKLERAAGDVSVLSKNDLRRMATSRLTVNDMLTFAGERKHWDRTGGFHIANTAEWTNKRAVQKMHDALNVDVNASIMTPQAGDVPTWGSNEVGKFMLQLRKFSMAAQHRILLAGMQRADSATLASVVLAGAMGALTRAYNTVDWVAEDPYKKLRETPLETHILNGLDYSGYAGLSFELLTIPSAVGYDIRDRIIGKKEWTDVGGFTVEGAAKPLGPNVAGLARLGVIINDTLDGDISDTTIYKARTMIPTQNHLAMKFLWNLGEEELKEIND